MKSKYSGNYYKRYIKRFLTSGYKSGEHGFEIYAKSYIEHNGFEEFSKLVREIDEIKANDDWQNFKNDASSRKNSLAMQEPSQLADAAVKIHISYLKENDKTRVRFGSDGKAVSGTHDYAPGYMARNVYKEMHPFNKKRSAIKYLLLGLLCEIFVLILKFTGSLEGQLTVATVIAWILAIVGALLLIMGIINLVSKNKG